MIREIIYEVLGCALGLCIGIASIVHFSLLDGNGLLALLVLFAPCLICTYLGNRLAVAHSAKKGVNVSANMAALEQKNFEKRPESVIMIWSFFAGELPFLGLIVLLLIVLPRSSLDEIVGWGSNPWSALLFNTAITTAILALGGWVGSRYLVQKNILKREHSAIGISWKGCVAILILQIFPHWQAVLANPFLVLGSALYYIPGVFAVAYFIKRAQARLPELSAPEQVPQAMPVTSTPNSGN